MKKRLLKKIKAKLLVLPENSSGVLFVQRADFLSLKGFTLPAIKAKNIKILLVPVENVNHLNFQTSKYLKSIK